MNLENTMSKPYCRYCKRDIRLYYFGNAEYPYQKNYGPIWKCVPCDAYVGCHKGTERPLGLVADAATRAAKIKAHAAFDPLWMRKMRKEGISKSVARGAGYRWLADQLGIPKEKCHIGMFSVDTCLRVIEICENVGRR